MAVRQLARNRNRIAEISVPEWAIPTQKTKLTRYVPQLVGCLTPAAPRPVMIWYAQHPAPRRIPDRQIPTSR